MCIKKSMPRSGHDSKHVPCTVRSTPGTGSKVYCIAVSSPKIGSKKSAFTVGSTPRSGLPFNIGSTPRSGFSSTTLGSHWCPELKIQLYNN